MSALSTGSSNLQAPHVSSDGIWTQIIHKREPVSGSPALFLDRDGTIIRDVGYLSEPAAVQLIDGAAATIRTANRANIPVIVVTNQSGVGRGLFDWQAFAAVQERMLERLEQHGATISAVFACPHHPDAHPPYNHPDHRSRKPNPGMITRAAQLLSIDPTISWLIGDRASDIVAAQRAGLAGGMLVATGPRGSHGQSTEAANVLSSSTFQFLHAETIGHAPSIMPLFCRDHVADRPQT